MPYNVSYTLFSLEISIQIPKILIFSLMCITLRIRKKNHTGRFRSQNGLEEHLKSQLQMIFHYFVPLKSGQIVLIKRTA